MARLKYKKKKKMLHSASAGIATIGTARGMADVCTPH